MSYIDVVERLPFREFCDASTHCHVASRWVTSESAPPLHSHDFHELFWVDRGQGWHLCNGERRRMPRGTLTLIRAEDCHGFAAEGTAPYRIVNVAFARETWAYLHRRYGGLRGDPFEWPLGDREVHLSALDLSELEVAASELRGGGRSRRAIERFLLNVIYLLEQRGGGGSASDKTAAPGWLLEACQGICEKKRFVGGTPALAALAGKSPEHVAREAKRWLAKTPTEIVNEARLAHVASRLTETALPVVELALECGYENISHFYRLFRARYGTSPGSYRLREQRIIGG